MGLIVGCARGQPDKGPGRVNESGARECLRFDNDESGAVRVFEKKSAPTRRPGAREPPGQTRANTIWGAILNKIERSAWHARRTHAIASPERAQMEYALSGRPGAD